MSVEAKLNQLSLNLHNVSQTTTSSGSGNKAKPKPTTLKTQPVADSWEDESSDSGPDQDSTTSGPSTPLEAPGPDIKSPTTRAIDAEKELSGEIPDVMPTPPPTPISPVHDNMKSDWSTAGVLGGGRPTYTSISNYAPSNPSSSARSTPIGPGSMTPTQRYPTPNPPLDSTSRDRDMEQDRKRPEKTTATANRLIAGALGIKAPPKTDEQRRYDRAVKEQEIKRRNREKEERKRTEEEEERVRAAVWDS